MRYKDFCNKDNEIHFLKFVLDKAWHLIQIEAERQQQIELNKKITKAQKERNQVLKSRMTKSGIKVNDFAVRPRRINRPKLY